ncbi:FAD-binding protein [Nocardia beijingensis]|uniref:FAD-binding protein n=1 Tax=Nocardia beijingensis TaxID=95162 RepID=UPI0037A1F233
MCPAWSASSAARCGNFHCGAVSDRGGHRSVVASFDHCRPGRSRAIVGAGARWDDVLRATLDHDLMPPVSRLSGERDWQSIGGTLAVGGMSSRSIRYSAMVDNVSELEVVTGAGETTTCQPATSLFDAAAAGYGQSAVITGATLMLVPATKVIRMHWLLYATADEGMGRVAVLLLTLSAEMERSFTAERAAHARAVAEVAGCGVG